MEWEQQKKNLLDALYQLEDNQYYFDDKENDQIRTNIIKLEQKKTDEDFSEIKEFQEKLLQKLNRIKIIYQHPYYLIKPSTVVKLGDAFRSALHLDNTAYPLEKLIESVADSGGYYQNLYDGYIDGTLGGVVHIDSSKPIRPYAFYDFKNITEISAPNTTGTGKSAFVGCNGLRVFYAPKASTYNKGFGSDPLQFTHFTAGFDLYSVSKKTITYKAWASSTSTVINPVFTKNLSIQMISLPGVYRIGKEAFSGCTALKSAYFNRTEWSYSKNIDPPKEGEEPEMSTVEGVIGEKAFADCTSLSIIEAPGFKKINAEAFKNCKALSSISLSGIYSISDKAFLNCKNLKYVSLPAWSTMTKNAFNGCNQLESINLGVAATTDAFNTKTTLQTVIMSKATTINTSAFKGLTSLTTISFPAVKKIEKQAFDGCTGITLLDSPLVTVVSTSAFAGCTNLSFVNIAKCKEVQANAFKNCATLTDIIAPALTSIDKAAFTNCTALTNIYAPLCKNLESNPFNTELLIDLTLGEDKATAAVFEGVKAVQRLNLPECTEVQKQAFEGCALSYVSLPKCTTIGEAAFSDCGNLKYIVLPKVKSIGKNAFNKCVNLKKVILLHTDKVTLGANAFPAQAEIFVRSDGLQQGEQFNVLSPVINADGSLYILDIFDVRNNLSTPTECYQEFIDSNDRSLNQSHIGTLDDTAEVGTDNETIESYIRGFYLDVPFYKKLSDIDKQLKNKYNWEINNNKYEIKYNEDNTCYIFDKIPVESLTLYQIPKCTSLLQLDTNKNIIGRELTFNSNNTQYKIKTDAACRYISLKFDTARISPTDVQIYEIKTYNHKHYYEIQDNEFIVGPKFIYDETLKNYKKENMVKYLYVMRGQHQDDFWGKGASNIPMRIAFDKKFNEDLSHYTFFIDNTMPYIDVDPDLDVNKIPLTEEEKKREV